MITYRVRCRCRARRIRHRDRSRGRGCAHVSDLDHTKALGNCADAAQYVNVVRIRKSQNPVAHIPADVSIIHVETMSNHIAGMFAPGAPIVIEYQRNDLSSSGTSSIARLGSTSIGGGRTGWFRRRPASRLTSSATFFAVIATVLRMQTDAASVTVITIPKRTNSYRRRPGKPFAMFVSQL